MDNLKIGDIVVRKSYGGDVHFVVAGIAEGNNRKPVYILRGMVYRLIADSSVEDLEKKNPIRAYSEIRRQIAKPKTCDPIDHRGLLSFLFSRIRSKPGKILHLDSSSDFLKKCTDYYKEKRLTVIGTVVDESEQPNVVRKHLEKHNPDILVLTGHDGVKKNSQNLNSADSYRNSKYFIKSVEEARKYQPDPDKLFIFAGACQSFYEAIMAAGANFASSPGRILINALDPAIVSRKVSLTERKYFVTPEEIAEITISGKKGIWGVKSKGRMIVV